MIFEQNWFLSDKLISLNNNNISKEKSVVDKDFSLIPKHGADCPKSVQKQLKIFKDV